MKTQDNEYVHALGVIGNVWVRQNVLTKAGTATQRHKHHFDHVSLLAKGEVRVEVDGFEPTVFKAPTFIVVKKDRSHKFTALTDDVLWYCVFALRDEDGGQTDMYDGRNSPYGTHSDDFTPERMEMLEAATTKHTEG